MARDQRRARYQPNYLARPCALRVCNVTLGNWSRHSNATHHSHSAPQSLLRGEPPVTTRPNVAHQRWRVLAASAIALGGVLVAPAQGNATAAPTAPGAATRVIVQAATGSL